MVIKCTVRRTKKGEVMGTHYSKDIRGRGERRVYTIE